MNPVISIILPVYNSEEYLSVCLESLAGQTFQDLEILCVDDGSTDKSGQILDIYAAKDFRFRVFHQKNAGSSLSRNLALNNAHGRYIMFCDSDDWYEPNMCQRMLQTIEEKNVDMVLCNTEIVCEKAREQYMPEQPHLFPLPAGRYEISDSIIYKINILLWNKIFKKEIIEQSHLYFPAIPCADDDVFVQCYRCFINNFYMLDEKLYHYRVRENSIMDNFVKIKSFKHCLTYIEKNKYIYEYLDRNNLFQKYKEHFYESLIIDIYNVWQDISKKDQTVFLDTIREVLLITHYQCKKERSWRFINAIKNKQYLLAKRLLAKFYVPMPILWFRCIRYKFLSMLTFGKRHNHYMTKTQTVYDELVRLKEWKETNEKNKTE